MKVVNINKALLVGIIILIVVNSSLLIYQKYTNKETIIPKVKLKDQEEKGDIFAIMLEQEDGTYQASTSTSFNQPGYRFNSEKSGCIDINENKIESALSYNETSKSISLRSNCTAYCYVYFDIKPNDGANQLIDSGELWESGLEGDGYRYTGTNPANYICFGTTNKDTCIGNTDAYMYRIIGVFPDSSGNQHLKLIKKEALNTNVTWNDSNTNVDWGSSTLFNALNGSTYLTNATYMPASWSNRITSWTWSAVNTLTGKSSGPNYYSGVTTEQIYLHELNRNGKSSNIGTWTSPEKQIGLMYVSDYQMSLGSSALGYIGSTNKAILKTGWMHLLNNDAGAPSGYEWTISRYGFDTSSSPYRVWLVHTAGEVNWTYVISTYSARPVFYLNTDQVIQSGSGTIGNPFILSD